ncbi:hypothetical protein D3C76_1484360 [compost metagenome]
MFGEELLDFGVAGALEASGQFVVGQIGFQRIIAQGLAVAKVRAGITLGQGALGLVVILALSGDIHRLRGLNGSGTYKKTRYNTEKATAHETSGHKKHDKPKG